MMADYEENLYGKRMKRRFKYKFIAVKKAIDDWNPYGLVCEESPNELDQESYMVAVKITENATIEQITQVISAVFSSQFERKGFNVNDCKKVALEVRKNLNLL